MLKDIKKFISFLENEFDFQKDEGVFIEPYVTKKDSELEKLGFWVYHKSNSDYLFNPIKSIIFINEKNDRIEIFCSLKFSI